jgi:hypothetical protein
VKPVPKGYLDQIKELSEIYLFLIPFCVKVHLQSRKLICPKKSKKQTCHNLNDWENQKFINISDVIS